MFLVNVLIIIIIIIPMLKLSSRHAIRNHFSTPFAGTEKGESERLFNTYTHTHTAEWHIAGLPLKIERNENLMLHRNQRQHTVGHSYSLSLLLVPERARYVRWRWFWCFDFSMYLVRLNPLPQSGTPGAYNHIFLQYDTAHCPHVDRKKGYARGMGWWAHKRSRNAVERVAAYTLQFPIANRNLEWQCMCVCMSALCIERKGLLNSTATCYGLITEWSGIGGRKKNS